MPSLLGVPLCRGADSADPNTDPTYLKIELKLSREKGDGS
jgi:hypothetical protein